MRSQQLDIRLAGETFLLLPQKAMYRPARAQLILSDLHLGKSTHFRKKGIPLPASAFVKDFDLLHYLLDQWQPQSVLFLGDLFHSDYNREWLWLKSLLMHYPNMQFILIEGNHDILDEMHYSMPNLLTACFVEEEHLLFSHYPLEDPPKLNICGHLHPGVRIRGRARESMNLPCFYHTESHFVLPAFGYHTGLQILEQEKGHFYLIASGNVIPHRV